MKVIGFDPGISNFGVGVIVIPKNLHKRVIIKEVVEIESALRNLTNQIQIKKPNAAEKAKIKSKKMTKNDLKKFEPVQESMLKFYNAVADFFDLHNPDVVVIERFQARGLGGTTIEAISMMIAIIAMQCISRDIKFYTCTAAEWKNTANKHIVLDSLYPVFKKTLSNHVIDGSMMALIIASKHNNIGAIIDRIINMQTSLTSYVKKQSLIS
jgi:Holliday junction resolvasome RuvABC endonuclease subunit